MALVEVCTLQVLQFQLFFCVCISIFISYSCTNPHSYQKESDLFLNCVKLPNSIFSSENSCGGIKSDKLFCTPELSLKPIIPKRYDVKM